MQHSTAPKAVDAIALSKLKWKLRFAKASLVHPSDEDLSLGWKNGWFRLACQPYSGRSPRSDDCSANASSVLVRIFFAIPVHTGLVFDES